MKTRLLIITICVMALSACGSSPETNFYTLTAISGKRCPLAEPVQSIAVMRFDIPSILDRQELVRGGDGNRLIISDNDRWGGPLDNVARTTLSEDLQSRLPANVIVAPDGKGSAMHLVVEANNFMPYANGATLLDADWFLEDADSAHVYMRRHFHISVQDSSQGGGAQATAMSKALGELADDICGSMARQPPLHPPASVKRRHAGSVHLSRQEKDWLAQPFQEFGLKIHVANSS